MIGLALAFALLAQDPPSAEQIEQFVEQLGGEFEEERETARAELEKAGAAAEPQLIEGLKRDDYRIRKACLELLAAFESAAAAGPAAELFRSAAEERTVRQAAFECLCAAGKAAEDVLIEALDSPEGKWRSEALKTLTEFRSERCAEKVAALYDRETDVAIKDAAFRCLQNVGKPAQPFLLKLLGSQDPAVRRGAIVGLRNIGAASDEIFGPVAKLFLTETGPEALGEAYTFLAQAGQKAESTFLEGLKSAQEPVRMKSIDGLDALHSEAALGPLGELFEKDPSEAIRVRAGDVLEKFELKAEDAFVRALSNPNVKTRFIAMAKLQNIRSPKAYAQIAEVFRSDADADMHRAAFNYLKSIGILAEKELLLALKDKVPEIRREAIEALGEARSEAAIEPLLELVTDLNEQINRPATDALVRIGAKAVAAAEAAAEAGRIQKKEAEKIVGFYRQEQVEFLLQKSVTQEGGSGYFDGQFAGVEAIGVSVAVPILLKMATDPLFGWRLEDSHGLMKELATMALGALGDKSVTEALKKRIEKREDPANDEEYRQIAVALCRLGDRAEYDKVLAKMNEAVAASLAQKDHEGASNLMFAVGVLRNRAGDRKGAFETYAKLVEMLEGRKLPYCGKCARPLDPSEVEDGKCKGCKEAVTEKVTDENYAAALYNLACLHALEGRKGEALDRLERAVDEGFKDRDWIRMDRDLDGVRDEERYRKLITDASRFVKPQ